MHRRIVKFAGKGQLHNVLRFFQALQGNVSSREIFVPGSAAGIEAERLLSESGGLLVVSNQKVFRGEIALGNVVAGIEADPLFVASDRLLNVARCQVVVQRGDMQAVPHGLAIRGFESLADMIGSQSVLIEVVVGDGEIGVGQSKFGV